MTLSTYNNEAAEVAARNASRDADKYEVKTLAGTKDWLTVSRIGAEERSYSVLVDESNVPFFCTCPFHTKHLTCKHEYLAAETLALWNAEEDFANRHEADYAGRF